MVQNIGRVLINLLRYSFEDEPKNLFTLSKILSVLEQYHYGAELICLYILIHYSYLL